MSHVSRSVANIWQPIQLLLNRTCGYSKCAIDLCVVCVMGTLQLSQKQMQFILFLIFRYLLYGTFQKSCQNSFVFERALVQIMGRRLAILTGLSRHPSVRTRKCQNNILNVTTTTVIMLKTSSSLLMERGRMVYYRRQQ